MTTLDLPEYLTDEILFHPENRKFPEFSAARLLNQVFEPTQGCKVCILTDFEEPQKWMKDFAFLEADGFPVQKKGYENFYQALHNGVMDELGMTGGEMFAYHCTNGSNLDMKDDVYDTDGNHLSLDKDIYPNYDIILCITDWSATAPLTAKCKEFGFRGATMHGMNDVILSSGLAVNYDEVSADAEKIRKVMTKADSIEIDFTLCDANGHFPMKYEDGTLGVLDVKDRNIVKSTLIEGNQTTIDEHNARLADDPMTGTLGELGFGTQVLPVSYSDIQDEKVLGTCHLATGRDDHLGGDIIPEMFKKHENSTHDDILFAPHKTPNFDISQVRMNKDGETHVLIEHFRPSRFLMEALQL